MTEPSEEVKEVERRYEETIDKMQQLVDRLKTERMSQAEFEQYAKEHGYIISTTNIIEQIRDEIEQYEVECMLILPMTEQTCNRCTNDTFKNIYQIIDHYTK